MFHRLSDRARLTAALLTSCLGLSWHPALAARDSSVPAAPLAAAGYLPGGINQKITLAKRALMIAGQRGGPNHPSVPRWLEKLGSLYEEAGLYDEAELAYQQALAAAEKALGTADPSIISIADRLGSLYYRQQRFLEAEGAFHRSIGAAEKLGSSNADLAAGLINLAMTDKAEGKGQEAITLLERALAVAGNTPETGSLRLGQLANQLGVYCAEEGRPAEAEVHFKRAISALETVGNVNGALARTFHNLAMLSMGQGQYKEAEDAALRSLSLLAQDQGHEKSQLFEALNTLAAAYHMQGQYGKAEPLIESAAAIAEVTFAASDPSLAKALHNLALVYKAERRIPEAIVLYNRALAAGEAALGPDDGWVGTVVLALAVTYAQQGQTKDAELLFRRAIAIGEKGPGPDNPFLASVLFNLSVFYASQMRYAEAEVALKRALEIRLRAYGPSHPSVREAESALLLVQKAAHQPSEPYFPIAQKTSALSAVAPR